MYKHLSGMPIPGPHQKLSTGKSFQGGAKIFFPSFSPPINFLHKHLFSFPLLFRRSRGSCQLYCAEI